MKFNVYSTLFIGIDVSLQNNVLCAMNFDADPLLESSYANNRIGAEKLVKELLILLDKHPFKSVVVALESTSVYSFHLANYLSDHELLSYFQTYVYCLNPKIIKNYKKTFVQPGKTDPYDAFVIADFARVGKISSKPWNGTGYLALKRLTRHRLHLVEMITAEKAYFMSNLFLKFSELAVKSSIVKPFSDNFGAASVAIMTEFLSLEEITTTPLEELAAFIDERGRHRITNPTQTAEIIQKAAVNSYRLDQKLYEPLNTSLSVSINCINAYNKEIKIIDKAIEKAIKSLNTNEYQCLLSIPGIGPVFAGGIIAEIGSIHSFKSHDALACYTGLTWKKNTSGGFVAEDSQMKKTGNKFLRYYIIEATNSMRNHLPEYHAYYAKKYDESKSHQHKRALVLTSRKTVRLIYKLLADDQLYSPDKVNTLS